MSESPDEPLEPEEAPEASAEPAGDEDDEPRWGGEESLGMLPPD